MTTLITRIFQIVVIIGASIGAASASYGQALASDSPATQQLYKALTEPAEIVGEQVPFREVINQLRQRYRIPIQVDNASVASAGVTAVTPVTGDIRGVSLGSALNLLLRDLNLDYVVKDEVLLIVSREAGAHMLETQVYDVADLLSEPSDAVNLVGAVALVVPHSQSGNKPSPANSGPETSSSGTTPSATERASGSSNQSAPTPPSASHQSPPPTAAPMTAEKALAGGAGAQVIVVASPAERDVVLFHGSLAVRATSRAQHDVQRLLARLRDANAFPKHGAETFEPRPIRR
ncbi:MAG TPA: hypothetical protein VKB78_11060 [Pirellulales bacterium]|nr:hypothetical protein [Pirellulales bacterium]